MPFPDSLTQIAPDIYQLRLPLPFALRIVNVYLLRGGAGWTIVDTGLNTPDGQQTWREALAVLDIQPGQIEQIILTHVHPDHYGMSGWLQEWSRNGSQAAPPVRLSVREKELAGQWWINRPLDRVAVLRQAFSRWGLNDDESTRALGAFGEIFAKTSPQATGLEIIGYGDTIRLGERTFQAIHTPGHADGHLIFYDQSDRLLLSGDHVLMKITPNIGLWPDSDSSPLTNYLRTLVDLAELDVRLALPGHKQLIEDWGGRLAELRVHHAARLQVTLDGVGSGATVYDVTRHMFEMESFTPHEVRFAMAETLAHLDHLRQAGELKQTGDEILYYVRS